MSPEVEDGEYRVPINGIGLSHLRLKVSALVSERQFEDADRLRGVVTAGKSGFPDPRVHLLRVASGVCAARNKESGHRRYCLG